MRWAGGLHQAGRPGRVRPPALPGDIPGRQARFHAGDGTPALQRHPPPPRGRSVARFAFTTWPHTNRRRTSCCLAISTSSRPPEPLVLPHAGWNSVIDQPTNLGSRRSTTTSCSTPATPASTPAAPASCAHLDERHFNNNDRAASEAVSDHRPAWAEIATGMADDDG